MSIGISRNKVVGVALLIEDEDGTRTMAVSDDVQTFELSLTTHPLDRDLSYHLDLGGNRIYIQTDAAPLEKLISETKPLLITVINVSSSGDHISPSPDGLNDDPPLAINIAQRRGLTSRMFTGDEDR